MSDIQTLSARALADVAAAQTPEAVEALRVGLLGKQGSITAQLKQLGALPPDQRKAAGRVIGSGVMRLSGSDAAGHSIKPGYRGCVRPPPPCMRMCLQAAQTSSNTNPRVPGPGRPEPPDLSAKPRPPRGRGVEWVRRPSKPAGSSARR